MIKHIVMWKLKEEAEGNTKAENGIKMKELLDGLKETIEQIVDLETGINDVEYNASNFDVILITTFKSFDDLNLYQSHPSHVEVANFIKKIVESRSAVDYTLA